MTNDIYDIIIRSESLPIENEGNFTTDIFKRVVKRFQQSTQKINNYAIFPITFVMYFRAMFSWIPPYKMGGPNSKWKIRLPIILGLLRSCVNMLIESVWIGSK